MAHKTADYVEQEHTGFTGTGEYTDSGAAAPTDRRTVASQFATGDTGYFVAIGRDSSGNDVEGIEIFLGTKSATGLARTTIIVSTNSNAAVNWATAAKVAVMCTIPASRALQLDNNLAALLPAASAEPGIPAASTLYVYARDIVTDLTLLKMKRPDGFDSPIQEHLAFNRQIYIRGAGAVLVSTGGTLTTTGTLASVTPASGSAKNQTQRVQLPTSATAGNVAGYVPTTAGNCPCLRGNVVGEGGFLLVQRIALNQLQTGMRMAAGLADSVTLGTNVDPTTNTTPGKVTLAINASTGNWNLCHNVTGSAPTVIALGANFPVDTTSLMELLLFCRPHNGTSAGNISYRVRRYTTNGDAPAFETSGVLSTNIPAATTLLYPWGYWTNNATAAAVQVHFVSIALGTDF